MVISFFCFDGLGHYDNVAAQTLVPPGGANSRLPHGGMWVDTYTRAGYVSTMESETSEICLKRLSKIEGQVRGIAKMVDEKRYCIDIITQISAVRAALRRVEEAVLKDHVGHCVEHAIASGNKAEQRQKVAELMDVLARTVR
jgi:DNA-binding FrmR family transcriptional regulator